MGTLLCLALGCGAHRSLYPQAPPPPAPPERLAHAILYDESPPDYRSFDKDTRFLRVRVAPFFCLDSTLVAEWRSGGPAHLLCEVPDPEEVRAAAERWSDSENQERIGFTRDIPPRRFALETSDPVILEALETLWAQLADLTFYECTGCYDATGILIETYCHRGLRRRLVVDDCSVSAACGHYLSRMMLLLQGEILAGTIPEGWLCHQYPGGLRRLGTVDGEETYVAIPRAERLASLRDAIAGAWGSEGAVRAVVQPTCAPLAPPTPPGQLPPLTFPPQNSEAGVPVIITDEMITSMDEMSRNPIPCDTDHRYPPTRKHW